VISGSVESFVSGAANIGETGGLIGRAMKNVQQNYTKGNVTVTSVNGQNTGGFIGVFAPSSAAAVEDNYSLASVAITGTVAATPPGAFVGTIEATGSGTRVLRRNYAAGPITTGQGFAGSSATVTSSNNFFDNQTTGQSTTAGTTAVGRSTSIMKSLTNYTSASWDFVCETANGTEDIWGRNSSDNLSYPFLMWEGFVPQCIFWVGGVSNDWATPSNWEPEEIPATGADIVFSPQAMRDLQLDISRTIGDLYFNASAKHVELGSNNLTMNGTVNGANATNYIQTNGTGLLIKNIPNSESFQFPVGNASYNPVTIVNNNSASDIFSVKVRDEVLVKGISGRQVTQPHVNTTWDISKTNANTGSGVDFVFQWESSQERNSIATYSLNHFNGTVWDFAVSISQAVSGTSTKTMNHNGYTGTFSPFAIGENTSVLPVNILEFTAKARGTSAELRWVTATEINNAYFGIERSSNGMEWEEIGRRDGAGTSYSSTQYGFTDYKPYDNSYYRLRQVDINGSEEYSEIRMVQFPDPMYLGQMVHAYPNPSNGVISIEPQTQIATSISIYDVTGKLVYQELIKKTTQIDNLSAGVYILKAQVGDRQEMKKIIVQNE
jgi:hypothetical protein